jgi:hypothetical protein
LGVDPACRRPARWWPCAAPPTRQRAGEHRLGDAGHRHPEVQGGLHRPAAGALLFGLVEDDVDERLAGLGVDLAEHLGGDLHQEAVQVAGVPLGEHLGDLRRGEAEAVTQQLVGLADELHVGVLDAVVHHLHEVARAVGPMWVQHGTPSTWAEISSSSGPSDR